MLQCVFEERGRGCKVRKGQEAAPEAGKRLESEFSPRELWGHNPMDVLSKSDMYSPFALQNQKANTSAGLR